VIDVRLREVRAEDLPVLYANQADAEVARQFAVPRRTHEAFFAHWGKLLVDPSVNHRAVLVDGALAGFVGAWNREGQRLVGYQLGRAFWGQGAASAALKQFLSIETSRPLTAEVAERNAASTRVLEKCGFVRTGASELTEDGDTFVELHYRLDA
jgi:RimJ/RimL family protein N-acetyltransferase